MRGVALTAEVAGGDHGYDHWLVGVTYYFGGNKSLRDRQRRDDPPSLMPQIIHGLGVYGAEFNRKGNEYLAANSGAGSLSGSYGLESRMSRYVTDNYGGVEQEFDSTRLELEQLRRALERERSGESSRVVRPPLPPTRSTTAK